MFSNLGITEEGMSLLSVSPSTITGCTSMSEFVSDGGSTIVIRGESIFSH